MGREEKDANSWEHPALPHGHEPAPPVNSAELAFSRVLPGDPSPAEILRRRYGKDPVLITRESGPRPTARPQARRHAPLPPLAPAAPVPDPPPLRASEASVRKGAELLARNGAICHGGHAVRGVKDLRLLESLCGSLMNEQT